MVKDMGADIFLISGTLSLLLIYVFIWLLKLVIPQKIEKTRRVLSVSIGLIFITFNVLYFTNIIPPIPLSLKEVGAYHSVERIGSDYRAEKEAASWFDIQTRMTKRISVTDGGPVYVFSSVFAPTRLNTEVYHLWQYFDRSTGEWIETDRLSYQIQGGRDGGYRGYSRKQNLAEGRWRVDIVTERGQVIGRHAFEVVDVSTEPAKESVTL
jgi:hypothetical protein